MLSGIWAYIAAGSVVVAGVATTVVIITSDDEPDTPQPATNSAAIEEPAVEPEPILEPEITVNPPEITTADINPNGSGVFGGIGKPGWSLSLVSFIVLDERDIALGNTEIADDGSWQVALNTPLAAGDHRISAVMTSPDESTSLTTKTPIPLRIDAPAPEPKPEPEPAETEVEEPINTSRENIVLASPDLNAGDNPVVIKKGIPTPRIGFNLIKNTISESGLLFVSGKGEPGHYVRNYVDGKFIGDSKISRDGDWALSTALDLTYGSHELKSEERERVSGAVSGTINTAFNFDAPRDDLVVSLATPEVDSSQLTTEKFPAPEEETDIADEDVEVQSSPTLVTQIETPEPETPAVEIKEPGELDNLLTQAEEDARSLDPVIIISEGDNLWQLARGIYGRGIEYDNIFEANKQEIENPDLIFPGQVFVVPRVSNPE